jgi:exosortase A
MWHISLMDKEAKIQINKDWIRWILLLSALIILLFIFYSQTVISIVGKWWTSDTYAHGMIIIPLSLFMIWTQRNQLKILQPKPTWWGIALLLPALILWLFASAVDVLVVQQLALLCMVWALIFGILGWIVVKHVLFPLAFLFFAIPIGEGLIPILRDFTAVFTVKALLFTGIPVYWEGLYFTIPSGNFEVAKACSGARYLFASIALGCLFAYISFSSIKKRALFILVSILLPIIANGLRAYGIVLIAHYSDFKYAVGVDHLVYGWLFFGFIMFLLFYISNKWRDKSPPIQTINTKPVTSISANIWVIPILFLVIIATGPVAQLWMSRESISSNETILSVPRDNGKWRQVESLQQKPWKISFNNASHEVKTIYKNHELVWLYIGYYATESQNSELISQDNWLYDIKQWTEVRHGNRTVTYLDKSVSLYEKVLSSNEHERILWYWYELNGVETSNIYIGKLVQAWQRMTGKNHGGAIIAILTDVEDERHVARERLQNFVNEMYPAIKISLSEVRKVR